MNLLVSDPTNIRYLTGFVSAEPQAREAFVLVTPKKTYLFTNSLYLEQAKTLGFPVIPISRDNPLPQALLSVIPGLTRNPSKQNTGSRLKGRDDTRRWSELTKNEKHSRRGDASVYYCCFRKN